MKTISTKYYGTTNANPSRIKATDGDNTIWHNFDHGYSLESNYIIAAKKLKDKLNWNGRMFGGHAKDGMVFVFEDQQYVI